MKVESFGISDIGLVRLENEDVWAELPNEQFYIIADGMGGHKAGEIAAEELISYLCRLLKKTYHYSYSVEEWTDILSQGIQSANAHILNLASQDKEMEGMGTTLCLGLFTDQTLIYAHVGDSRIYRLRKGRLTQLTRDHSLRGELIAKGELDEAQAFSFPYKNVITRAIGTHKTVKPDIQTDPVEIGDIYFLCTDGLTDTLSDTEIHDILDTSSSIQDAAETLVLEAKKKGGSDNITILIMKVI